MGREDEIRLIAYAIWEEEYCPDGRDCEHWLTAEAVWEEREKAGKAGAGGASATLKRSAGRTGKGTAASRKSRKIQS